MENNSNSSNSLVFGRWPQTLKYADDLKIWLFYRAFISVAWHLTSSDTDRAETAKAISWGLLSSLKMSSGMICCQGRPALSRFEFKFVISDVKTS